MDRGFIIVAQNNGITDYIKCAKALCLSIKQCMPSERVALLTDFPLDNHPFDYVVQFPYGDRCADIDWKLANDWQIYSATPFEFTIKLEADMYLPRNINHWWSTLQYRDLVVASTIRDIKGAISSSRYYRQIFDANKLPDLYNAITYFRKSKLAAEFYGVVKEIFENWNVYKNLLKGAEHEQVTTDVAYAIAATAIGVENCILPKFNQMSMVHMKQYIVDTIGGDWTKEFVWEILPECFRIESIPQFYPVHYHIKEFAGILLEELKNA